MSSRQEIIANNKSLRLIKTELDALSERGFISDDVFDQIHRLLPTESPLSGAPTPAAAKSPTSPPVKAMASLNMDNNDQHQAPPPTYQQAAQPPLPARKTPAKPVIARARATYEYTAQDGRDLSFAAGNEIEVYEYMNADWWLGKNTATGAEGIFPNNRVEVINQQNGGYGNEKAGYPAQPTYANNNGYNSNGYPAPPKAQNPYNSSVPPMAIAEGSGSNGGGVGGRASGLSNNPKVNENGKKFGKKLGNAAIFGAGATIGGKIVNGIF